MDELLAIGGVLFVDTENGNFKLVFNEFIENNKKMVNETLLSVEIQKEKSEKVTFEKHRSLLKMDESEFDQVIRNLRIDGFAEVYKELTNKDLYVKSMDGDIIFNVGVTQSLPKYYKTVYAQYKSDCKTNNDIPYTKVYIYSEPHRLYFLIDGNDLDNIKFTYNLTDEIKNNYKEVIVQGKTFIPIK
jgi:ribosome-interacting GTPase 1